VRVTPPSFNALSFQDGELGLTVRRMDAA